MRKFNEELLVGNKIAVEINSEEEYKEFKEEYPKVGDELTLTKEQFIKWSMEGFVFEYSGNEYFYDATMENPFRLNDTGLNGYWHYLDEESIFKVTKSPYEEKLIYRRYRVTSYNYTFFVDTHNIEQYKKLFEVDEIECLGEVEIGESENEK